jgi:tRNA uridine 5-carbamoylmethylation protein Kti12
MKVINLFGSPGTGKSTTAAGLFYLMKCQGMSVELVTEYAKDLVWQERKRTFRDQLYITAKQNHRLEVLKGKVDYAITDSPLLLGVFYTPDDYYKNWKSLVMEVFNSYDNVNIFLNRVKPYNPVGRNQTQEESDAIAARIKQFLINEKINFMEFNADADAPRNILSQIELL